MATNQTVKVGHIELTASNFKSFTTGIETDEEKQLRETKNCDISKSRQQNYLGGFGSLLIAGIITSWQIRRYKRRPPLRTLMIETMDNATYTFTEEQLDIDATVTQLNTLTHAQNTHA